MKWRGGRRSDNIEDQRGRRAGTGGGFPGGFRLPQSRGVKRGGIGGIGLIIVVLLAMFFGFDPSILLQGVQGGGPSVEMPKPGTNAKPSQAGNDEAKAFVSVVLADTEDTWTTLFRQLNRRYEKPKLVLYSGYIRSACGLGQAAAGPFYCPGDRKVYLDLSFFSQLARQFKAPGDFAQAYVIAHEIGHHVQTLFGIAEKVQAARQRVGTAQGNRLQVMMELQADCFAGVWAKNADKARNILERGDVEEGIGAASAVGDDTLQRRTQGHVVPDAFTHGSSAQRVRWFKHGFGTGDPRQCDTFKASQL